jgi:flavin-dependent dehydrogenase
MRTLYREGTFAVGNAAGEAHPLVAEGITMAIQSSWLLADALAAAGGLGDAELARAARLRARVAIAFRRPHPRRRRLRRAHHVARHRRDRHRDPAQAPAALTLGARLERQGHRLDAARRRMSTASAWATLLQRDFGVPADALHARPRWRASTSIRCA